MAARRAARRRTRTIGILMNGAAGEPMPQTNANAFVEGMRALGWVDGRNLRIEYRWNSGSAERAKAHAQDLAKLNPEVILCRVDDQSYRAAPRHPVDPIVFLQVSDPLAQGYVTSVTRPGGNVTGFSNFEFSIGGKWIELLKEVAPKLTRVAVMSNPDTAPQTKFFHHAIDQRPPRSKLKSLPRRCAARPTLRVSSEICRGTNPGGLILPTDSYTRLRQTRIAELTREARVPALSAVQAFVEEGGLLYYGPTQHRGARGPVPAGGILCRPHSAKAPSQAICRCRPPQNSTGHQSQDGERAWAGNPAEAAVHRRPGDRIGLLAKAAAAVLGTLRRPGAIPGRNGDEFPDRSNRQDKADGERCGDLRLFA